MNLYVLELNLRVKTNLRSNYHVSMYRMSECSGAVEPECAFSVVQPRILLSILLHLRTKDIFRSVDHFAWDSILDDSRLSTVLVTGTRRFLNPSCVALVVSYNFCFTDVSFQRTSFSL
jgi:hypothetical protein